MSLSSILDVVALVVCSIYGTIPLFWLLVHPFIDRWRRQGRRAYVLILPIWAFLITVTFLILWPFRSAHLYERGASWAVALLLLGLGLSIYRAAFKNFHHSQLSGLDELEPGQHRQQLVTGGIRSRMRHPIYLAHLCEVMAWCVGTGLAALYVLAAFAIVTGAVMIRIEDRELEARFGLPFRRYRQQVPAVFPRFGR